MPLLAAQGYGSCVDASPTGSSLRYLLLGLAAVVFVSACGKGPPEEVAAGQRVQHPSQPLSMVSPEGWQISSPRDGFALIRTTPYGGGYPTFNVRIVGTEDLPSLQFDGKEHVSPAGRAEYRYERWSNARGRGFRLEALVDSQGTWLFVDASVWDPARSRDEEFFDLVFWPLLNSVRTGS